MHDTSNTNYFQHTIPMIRLTEFVIFFLAPRIGSGSPTERAESLYLESLNLIYRFVQKIPHDV